MLLVVLLTILVKIGDWRYFYKYFLIIFEPQSCSDGSTVDRCKLTPTHIRFSSKLLKRVILWAEADSENFMPVHPSADCVVATWPFSACQ